MNDKLIVTKTFYKQALLKWGIKWVKQNLVIDKPVKIGKKL